MTDYGGWPCKVAQAAQDLKKYIYNHCQTDSTERVNIYNIPVFFRISVVNILVLICITYPFFPSFCSKHTISNIVCHAADIKRKTR